MPACRPTSPVRLAVALVLGLALPVRAQEPAAADTPDLTPASVALFIESLARPGTQQLLNAALAHPDTMVRRVAARVARATQAVGQLPAIERAFAAEPAGSFTGLELEAALASLRGRRPAAEANGSEQPAEAGRPASPVRLWPTFVPGLPRELLRLTGCRLSKDGPFIVTQVQYRQTGSIERGVVEGSHLSEACRRVGRVMTALSTATPGRPIQPGGWELVVLAFDSDYLDCLEGHVKPGKPVKDQRPVPVAAGGVQSPTKIRNVNAVYPATALENRIQGLVILQTVITPEGCVRDLEVRRSVAPALDFAALRAVMKWRYTPTIVEGVAVPVIMFVSVNFTLQP